MHFISQLCTDTKVNVQYICVYMCWEVGKRIRAGREGKTTRWGVQKRELKITFSLQVKMSITFTLSVTELEVMSMLVVGCIFSYIVC